MNLLQQEQDVSRRLRARVRALEGALRDLIRVIEADDLMPPSLSYFAVAKQVLAVKGETPAPPSEPRDSGDAALIDTLTELVYWLLGERGDFPLKSAPGNFWWRPELRERFTRIMEGSSSASSPTPQEEKKNKI